jgi:hypothetical protein
MQQLDQVDFDLDNPKNDILGDAYEYLIGKFASGAYYLPAGMVIGKAGFSFPMNTFIHVSPVYLRFRSIDQLTEKYLKTGAAKFVDTLTDSEYYDMLYLQEYSCTQKCKSKN